MEELVFLNGRLLPVSQAKLSPFDYGFLYGYGLFETMRAYSGKVFRLTQHLDRLKRSTEFLDLSDKISRYDLSDAVKETVQANKLSDARIRLTISPGPGDSVPDLKSCSEPTMFIYARSYIPIEQKIYKCGFKTCFSVLKRESSSPLSNLKTCNYLVNVLARREAKLAGVDEALLLNEKGQLTEGSASNLFIVSGNMILTPSVESGILPGVTREVVLKLAASLKITTYEKHLVPDNLLQADEAFITNSLLEIMPLVGVRNNPIGSGLPGPLTMRLMSAYKDLVSAEIEAI